MVIAILTVIVGAVVVESLPVAQFRAIAPPEVQIWATHVGTDAQTIEQSVATPIEQQMCGVGNMNYMYSLNAARLKECGLELHPEKTKVVYCKDEDRRRTYPNEKFDFLGYTFQPRRIEESVREVLHQLQPGQFPTRR